MELFELQLSLADGLVLRVNFNAAQWVVENARTIPSLASIVQKKKYFKGKILERLRMYGQSAITPEADNYVKRIYEAYGKIFYICHQFRACGKFNKVLMPFFLQRISIKALYCKECNKKFFLELFSPFLVPLGT